MGADTCKMDQNRQCFNLRLSAFYGETIIVKYKKEKTFELKTRGNKRQFLKTNEIWTNTCLDKIRVLSQIKLMLNIRMPTFFTRL